MKKCPFFKHSKIYYAELFLVLCFVLSVALGVKFFLDNEILKEVVASEMNISKKEVEIITQHLHETHKSANSTSAPTKLINEEDNNATK